MRLDVRLCAGASLTGAWFDRFKLRCALSAVSFEAVRSDLVTQDGIVTL